MRSEVDVAGTLAGMTAIEPRPDETLPHWDLTPFFPSIESREFSALTEEVASEVGRLQARFDDLGVRGGEPLPITPDVVAAALAWAWMRAGERGLSS